MDSEYDPECTANTLRNGKNREPRTLNCFQMYNPDVIGISLGIVELMVENYRTEFVRNTFMTNPEITKAILLGGFRSTRDPDSR